MLDFISYPMGTLLKFIYNTIAFKNYGLAIILLTVIIKIILLPLFIKQYRSTSKISELQPKMQEIQKAYVNDKEKLNQEMMKLYQDNKVSPAGGCLPLLIQMPILFSLYYVISQPLKYMFEKSPQIIQKLYEMIPAGVDKIANIKDISIINYFSKNPNMLANANNLIKKYELLNMNIFGVNLGMVPTLNYHKLVGNPMSKQYLLLLLVPILAIVTTYISIKFSAGQTPQTSDNEIQNSTQNSMALVSTAMTGFISFSVPAGLGLYWIISNILQIFQQVFMNRFIIKSKEKNIALMNKSV